VPAGGRVYRTSCSGREHDLMIGPVVFLAHLILLDAPPH
jgi:hypothetical protein